METQAHYRLVGTFVLMSFVSVILFIIWIGRGGLGRSYAEYDIFFKGSVSGLKLGSAVSYRGVPIGQVTDIAISPVEIEQIRVHVNIDRKVPIKTDMLAKVESQGLTGVSSIQLSGGSKDSPALIVQGDQPYPIIPSQSSLMEEVSDSLPAVLKRASSLVQDIREVFSEENKDSISKTLKNIEALTNYMAPGNDKNNSFIVSLQSTIKNLDAAVLEFAKMNKEFSVILNENRSGLKDFSANGLGALTKFLNEGRETLSTIRRIGESLERSPSRFFYNDPKQGVNIR